MVECVIIPPPHPIHPSTPPKRTKEIALFGNRSHPDIHPPREHSGMNHPIIYRGNNTTPPFPTSHPSHSVITQHTWKETQERRREKKRRYGAKINNPRCPYKLPPSTACILVVVVVPDKPQATQITHAQPKSTLRSVYYIHTTSPEPSPSIQKDPNPLLTPPTTPPPSPAHKTRPPV